MNTEPETNKIWLMICLMIGVAFYLLGFAHGFQWCLMGGGDMKIQKIESQSRRDFYAIYECEHCGHTERGSGYDDDNFHRNVIPKMKCEKCGKTADENYRPMGTKYPAYVVI